MSTFTIATLTLIVVVVLGLVVIIADEYGSRFGRIETYRISIRELPNVAAEIGAHDTDAARR